MPREGLRSSVKKKMKKLAAKDEMIPGRMEKNKNQSFPQPPRSPSPSDILRQEGSVKKRVKKLAAMDEMIPGRMEKNKIQSFPPPPRSPSPSDILRQEGSVKKKMKNLAAMDEMIPGRMEKNKNQSFPHPGRSPSPSDILRQEGSVKKRVEKLAAMDEMIPGRMEKNKIQSFPPPPRSPSPSDILRQEGSVKKKMKKLAAMDEMIPGRMEKNKNQSFPHPPRSPFPSDILRQEGILAPELPLETAQEAEPTVNNYKHPSPKLHEKGSDERGSNIPMVPRQLPPPSELPLPTENGHTDGVPEESPLPPLTIQAPSDLISSVVTGSNSVGSPVASLALKMGRSISICPLVKPAQKRATPPIPVVETAERSRADSSAFELVDVQQAGVIKVLASRGITVAPVDKKSLKPTASPNLSSISPASQSRVSSNLSSISPASQSRDNQRQVFCLNPAPPALMCHVCDTIFASKQALTHHIIEIHVRLKNLSDRCNVCNTEYPTHQELLSHNKIYHKKAQ